MHDFHEDWLIKRSKFAVPSKVLVGQFEVIRYIKVVIVNQNTDMNILFFLSQVIPAESSLEEMHQIYAAKENEILCGMNINSFI